MVWGVALALEIVKDSPGDSQVQISLGITDVVVKSKFSEVIQTRVQIPDTRLTV